MEILDPNTKSCTFLTLTTFNSNKGSVIPAMCSLKKDEPFLDSDRAYIAAESWRLSCAPNEHGIVYQYIPWTYYISVDHNLTQQQETDDEKTAPVETISLSSTTSPLLFTNIMQDKKILSDKQQLTIRTWARQNNKTLDLNRLSQRLLNFMNGSTLVNGSVISLRNPENGQPNEPGHVPATNYLYTLKEDPLAKLTGPGYGPQGLMKVQGQFYSQTDNSGNASQYPDQVHYVNFHIPKSSVPRISKSDLKRYFSSGVWLFRDIDADVVIGRPTFKIHGPRICVTSDSSQDRLNNGAGTPIVRLYCKNGGSFEVGQTVFQQYKHGTESQEKSSIITVCPEFVYDRGSYWELHLSGKPTPRGTSAIAAHSKPYSGTGHYADQLYYVYKVPADGQDADGAGAENQPFDDGDALFFSLKSTCEVSVTELDKAPINPENAAMTSLPMLVHKLHQRSRVVRRATDRNRIATFSPNDFMQYFNVGFKKDQEQPYVLCTSPNGGWRLVVLSDNLSSLRISKQMVDDMGLNDYMVMDGVEKENGQHQEVFPVVVEIVPDKTVIDDSGAKDWQWSWKEDFNNLTTAQSNMEMRQYQEFVKIKSDDGTDDGPLLNTDTPPLLLRSINQEKYYELVSMVNQQVIQTDVSTIPHPGILKVDEDGLEFYEFVSPQKGSYIDNDKTVSIGSFSIYEAIRIVVPSGLSFDPMISSQSDARILCELRLPFQNSAEVQQGFLKNEPLVMSTESAFYGDIIWNNPPSGLQYLPITTQGGIYDLEVAAELIARNPSLPPVRVQLGYSDIFQVKMRFINRN